MKSQTEAKKQTSSPEWNLTFVFYTYSQSSVRLSAIIDFNDRKDSSAIGLTMCPPEISLDRKR